MVIRFDNISKKYGQDCIIKDMSLAFLENQTTALIGPSGCGKTTLLRLLVGLVPQTTGKIYFNHQELTQKNVNDWRRQIGYVTQDGGLFPHLSALKNITLMADYLSYDHFKIQQRIQELSELLRLPESLLFKYPSELSGGERQRVSLMRALLLNPQCLLLDEPFGALDPITRNELQIELKQIFSKLSKTTLFVTHDMREAAYFGDEILLMRCGKIVQRGSFESLVQSPVEPFVADFIRFQQFPYCKTYEALS